MQEKLAEFKENSSPQIKRKEKTQPENHDVSNKRTKSTMDQSIHYNCSSTPTSSNEKNKSTDTPKTPIFQSKISTSRINQAILTQLPPTHISIDETESNPDYNLHLSASSHTDRSRSSSPKRETSNSKQYSVNGQDIS